MKNLIYLLTAVFALSVCNDAFAQRRNKNQEPKLKVKSSVMTSSWRFDGNITPSPATSNNQGNTVSNAVTNNQPVAVPTSDVDRDIPTSGMKDPNPNMVALIIANEASIMPIVTPSIVLVSSGIFNPFDSASIVILL